MLNFFYIEISMLRIFNCFFVEDGINKDVKSRPSSLPLTLQHAPASPDYDGDATNKSNHSQSSSMVRSFIYCYITNMKFIYVKSSNNEIFRTEHNCFE